MPDGSLLILTGPPGAGKTTVGKSMAASTPRSACISADWFWTTIVNGHIAPWERAADHQNRAMIRAALAAGVRMANAGYSTVLEGILGPWHLRPLASELAECSVPVDYAVLRPGGDVCLRRARARVHEGDEHRHALTEEGPIRHLWDEFSDLGALEAHVIDSSDLDLPETASRIRELIEAGALRLSLAEGAGTDPSGPVPTMGPDGLGPAQGKVTTMGAAASNLTVSTPDGFGTPM